MLHHIIHGQGHPLLILHGITLDHRYMEAVLEPVFETLTGWQRVYVDLPGHGLSPPRDSIASQDDLLRAILDFADATFGDRCFGVIGLSRGSYLARGILHERPGRISGAALLLPGGNPGSDPARLPSHHTVAPEPALRRHLTPDEHWAFDNIMVVQRRDIIDARRRIIAPAQAAFDAGQEARVSAAFKLSFEHRADLPPFEGPSLVVAGRQDSISGYLDAMDLLAEFPRATLAVLDAAGHALALERPDMLGALMRDWLMRLQSELPEPNTAI